MAKDYIVADIHVRDKEGFEKFREMALPVIEFESMDKARKFYESEAYQAAKAVREKACDTNLFQAEGV